MKGSIRTRILANGQKAYDALYRTADGTQRGKSFARRKDAERFLVSVVRDVQAGLYRDVRPISVRTFAAIWLQSLGGLKPSSVEAYTSIAKHLIRAWGDRAVHSIDVTTVNTYLTARARAGKRAKTLGNELRVIHKFLGDAREAGHLLHHPLTGSKALQRPRAITAEEETEEVQPFTVEEINAILDAIDPSFAPLVLCAVSTGLRLGELLGLQWQDIDYGKRQIRVRRTYWRGRDYVPKTPRSRREVDVGDQLLGVLGGLARARFGGEPPVPAAPVFLSQRGHHVNLGVFRERVWMPALGQAGISYRKPYALRHTFATLLLAQGQSIPYVSAQLGHSSPTMTLNVYAKFLPQERRESPAKFEAQLHGRGNPAVSLNAR